MQVKTSLNYLRMSPRKVRLIADLIRGMEIIEAENQLKFTTKKAGRPILKLLNSAVANASHNFSIKKDDLYISKIQVNEGPPLKRWTPRAMGRATPIIKRTSHIDMILETKKRIKAKKKKKEKLETIKLEELEKISTEKTKKEKYSKKPITLEKKSSNKSKLKSFGKKIFRRKSF